MTQPSSSRYSHWPISILGSIASFFNLLLPLVLVRVLPNSDIGIYKIFFLYLILIPELCLGGGFINGIAYWAGRKSKRVRALQGTAAVVLLFALLTALSLWVLSSFISSAFEWDAQYGALFALAAFGVIAAMFFEEAAIATGKVWFGAIFGSGFEIFRTLAMALLAIVSRDLQIVLLTHILLSTLKAFCGYVIGYQWKLVRFSFDREILRELFRYAFPVSLAGVLLLVMERADQLLLAVYLEPAEFAFYAIGCLIIPPLLVLEQSVTRVLIPQLSNAFENGERRRAAQLYAKASQHLGMIIIPAVVGLVVFAEPIIELLFTTRYSSSTGYLQLFAVSYLALLFPFDAVPRARGEARWILSTTIVLSLLTLGVCSALMISFGAYGALGGLLFMKALSTAFGLWYALKSSHWSLRDALPATELLSFSTFSLLLGAGSLGMMGFFNSKLGWFLVSGSTFFVLYFCAILIQKLLRSTKVEGRRVLQVTQYLGVGGLEKIILELSKPLKHRLGYDVHVFAYDLYDKEQEELASTMFQKEGIPVSRFRKRKGFSIGAIIALIKLIEKEKISILHTHDLGALIYGVCAKLFSSRPLRLVHTQHSFVHLDRKRRYRMYERIFTACADTLVTVSEEVAQQYVALGIRREKIEVVENGLGFEGEPAPPRQGKLERRRRLLSRLPAQLAADLSPFCERNWILYLARIHQGKGHDEAIAIWRKLPAKVRQQSVLLFVGPETHPGMEEEVRQLSQDAPMHEHIFFCDGTDVAGLWYQASDLFLSSSKFEGRPLAPLEALGFGVPIVVSNIRGHKFLAPYGSLYCAGDAQAGAEAMTDVLTAIGSDIEMRRAKRIAARVRSHYSAIQMARSYSEIYNCGERVAQKQYVAAPVGLGGEYVDPSAV